MPRDVNSVHQCVRTVGLNEHWQSQIILNPCSAGPSATISVYETALHSTHAPRLHCHCQLTQWYIMLRKSRTGGVCFEADQGKRVQRHKVLLVLLLLVALALLVDIRQEQIASKVGLLFKWGLEVLCLHY
jgi:hypothetical protein